MKNKKQLGTIIVTLFLLISIPITVFSVLSNRDYRKNAATTTNISVDFSIVSRNISPLTFGMDESGYGWTGSQGLNLTTDTKQQTALKTLGVSQMRINLGYATPGNSSSAIGCRQSGCDSSVPGMTWLNSVVAAGAEPEIEVQMQVGQEANWAVDAANMVRYFNITNNKNVKRWVVGNEPDNNGLSATAYSNGFNLMYDAMKAVDPTIKIGGPTTAWYNRGFIDTFLSIVGTRPDFIDYHDYGEGGGNILTDANLLAGTNKYENDANDLRALINSRMGATRGSQVEIELGEWNLSWSAVTTQLTHLATVWSASALGHMLKGGMIERQYADKNDALGALCQQTNPTQGSVTYTCNVDDPTPIYHGIGMFTGESLFPRFGTTLVSTTVSLTNVEAYASDNPKNIVVINKDPVNTQVATIGLNLVSSGTVDVWQKGPADKAPTKQTSLTVSGGSFSYSLAPYTVYTFLVAPGAPNPLTVSVTSPTNGSSVYGLTKVLVSATDNVSVTKVELYVDDNLTATSTTSPYTISWNTTQVANTTHSLYTKATDSANNQRVSPTISVTVNNADTDKDGFPDLLEQAIGTNPNQVCGLYAWPPDIDGDGKVSILDISKMASIFGAKAGDPNFIKREDLDNDGAISILDLSIAASYFGSSCTNPVKNQ